MGPCGVALSGSRASGAIVKRKGTGTEARIRARAEERAKTRAEIAAAREQFLAATDSSVEDLPSRPGAAPDAAAAGPAFPADSPTEFTVPAEAGNQRLDQFLSAQLPDVSRARVQLLLEQHKLALTLPDGSAVPAEKLKPNYRLRGGEHLRLLGAPEPPPLRAVAEDIPLDVIYEDADLAVINKPAGMTVHGGAGSEPDDERGRGTMVNALLHHFGALGNTQDAVRPGIVHRLDKQTSGLLVIAKNDAAHQKLSEAFAERRTQKEYVALVHGDMERDSGTINAPIARDSVRRTRMTTRGREGRTAVTHWKVRERLATPWGDFSLLDVRIETGRTHQIRVHLSSIGHPVVGDALYGAPYEILPRELANQPARKRRASSRYAAPLALDRNFLHAARLALPHPRTGKEIAWTAPLAPELDVFLATLRGHAAPAN